MKKWTKFFLLGLIVMLFALCVTACEKKEKDAAKGEYFFVYEKGPLFSQNNPDDKFILDGYGKGEYIRKGLTRPIKYDYAYDGTIHITDKKTGIKYTGTCKNGDLLLYDGNPESATVTEFLYSKR